VNFKELSTLWDEFGFEQRRSIHIGLHELKQELKNWRMRSLLLEWLVRFRLKFLHPRNCFLSISTHSVWELSSVGNRLTILIVIQSTINLNTMFSGS
jgi:hypothetical protein